MKSIAGVLKPLARRAGKALSPGRKVSLEMNLGMREIRRGKPTTGRLGAWMKKRDRSGITGIGRRLGG